MVLLVARILVLVKEYQARKNRSEFNSAKEDWESLFQRPSVEPPTERVLHDDKSAQDRNSIWRWNRTRSCRCNADGLGRGPKNGIGSLGVSEGRRRIRRYQEVRYEFAGENH